MYIAFGSQLGSSSRRRWRASTLSRWGRRSAYEVEAKKPYHIGCPISFMSATKASKGATIWRGASGFEATILLTHLNEWSNFQMSPMVLRIMALRNGSMSSQTVNAMSSTRLADILLPCHPVDAAKGRNGAISPSTGAVVPGAVVSAALVPGVAAAAAAAGGTVAGAAGATAACAAASTGGQRPLRLR